MTDQTADVRRASRAIALLRALALLAFGLSSAAAVDQYAGTRTFCAEGGGCAAVRASGVGQLLGDALPALGMLGFALVVLLSLARAPALQRAALAAAVAGGIGGVVLAALQLLVVGRVCTLCMFTDAAAVGAGLLATRLLHRFTPLQVTLRTRAVMLVTLVLVGIAPPTWAATLPPELPRYVQDELQRERASGGSAIVIVELSDFECPFCRALHPALHEAVERFGKPVRLVRRSIPLPSHPHALGAAASYRCAEEQQRGEAMAEVLFTTEQLSLRDCVEHARGLGLDVERFKRCLALPATKTAIERDVAEVRRSNFEGLPTVFIGDEQIVGFDAEAGAEPYLEALERAARTR